jgi:cell division protein FtsB
MAVGMRDEGSGMKRIRLSTLMLVIVIAALCLTVMVQQVQAKRREAQLAQVVAELHEYKASVNVFREQIYKLNTKLANQQQANAGGEQEK